MPINRLGDSTIGTLTGWLRGLNQRQDAISNNIANIDTPGYIRREAPFEAELRRAVGRGGTQLSTTAPGHIAAGGAARNQLGLQQAQRMSSSRMDQNSVDIDQEMVLLAETQMRYRAASGALSTKLATIRSVIRGG